MTRAVEWAASALLEDLFALDPAAARQLAPKLANFGVETPMRFGTEARYEPAADFDAALAELTVQTLGAALRRCDTAIDALTRRLRRGARLRLIAAAMTTVLSSGVVATTLAGSNPLLPMILGSVTLIAAVATLIASWLEGGDSSLRETYIAAVADIEQARLLEQEVRLGLRYDAAPDDMDQKVDAARALIGRMRSTLRLLETQ